MQLNTEAVCIFKELIVYAAIIVRGRQQQGFSRNTSVYRFSSSTAVRASIGPFQKLQNTVKFCPYNL